MRKWLKCTTKKLKLGRVIYNTTQLNGNANRTTCCIFNVGLNYTSFDTLCDLIRTLFKWVWILASPQMKHSVVRISRELFSRYSIYRPLQFSGKVEKLTFSCKFFFRIPLIESYLKLVHLWLGYHAPVLGGHFGIARSVRLSVRPSVCPMAQLPRLNNIINVRYLQLSHRRPPLMCGLRIRPRTDVDPPRFLPPSNCHRRGAYRLCVWVKSESNGSVAAWATTVAESHTHTHTHGETEWRVQASGPPMNALYHDCCCCCCCRLDCDVVTSLRSRRVKPLRVWCSTPRDNVISRYLYDYYVHTSVHVKTCVSSRSRLLESSVIASFHHDGLNGLGRDRIF